MPATQRHGATKPTDLRSSLRGRGEKTKAAVSARALTAQAGERTCVARGAVAGRAAGKVQGRGLPLPPGVMRRAGVPGNGCGWGVGRAAR